jgi:Tat protein translocase TatB subunit
VVGWLGVPEIIVILVIALIVFGPKKLPEMAKTIGKTVANIKKTTDGIMADIQQEIDTEEIQKTLDNVKDINPVKGLDFSEENKDE